MVRAVDRWALGGVAALLLVVPADVATGSRVALIPLLLLGPLVCAIGGGPVRTGTLALLATALALPLGAVDEVFGTAEHVVHLAVVSLGGSLAAVVAGVRARLEDRSRQARQELAAERAVRVRAAFLGRVGSLLEAPPDPGAMLAEVTALAVPEMADLCIVDLLDAGGGFGEAAVHARDDELAEGTRAMRLSHPIARGGPHPVGRVAQTLRGELHAEMDRGHFDGYAAAEQAGWLERLGYRSAMVAPLVARGRPLGTLSLVRVGPDAVPYAPEDLETAGEVARRAAQALDGARLFRELSDTESRLDAILTALAEAVTVQAPDGELVFANEAAAELLGFPDVGSLLATPVSEFFQRFVVLGEHGGPVDVDALPGRRALAGEDDPAPLVTRSVDKRTGDERWVLTRARPLRAPDGSVAYAVNVMEDVSELRRSERESRLLSATSALLSASLDVERTLEQAARAPVPELADLCWVEVADERGRLQVRATAGAGDVHALREAVARRPDDPDALAGALVDLRPRLVAALDDDAARRVARDPAGLDLLRRSAVGSLLAVPLLAGERAVGLMVLATSGSGRRLGEQDVRLAMEVAARAGIAVEHARVHDARTQLALTLQRSLLPPRLPIVPGLTIAARFRAASSDEAARVGGDFYDLFPSVEGWFVVIGDVTGKGAEAAAITSVARHTMRTAAVYEPSPAKVLGRLNDALAADVDRRRLCTALCVRVDPPGATPDGTVRVTLACAGHPPPLLLQPPGEGRAPVVPVEAAGPLLGAFETMSWTERTMDLEPGSSLVLYTDGVTDARGAGGRFGQERLEALCAGLVQEDADVVAGAVDDALLAFEAGHPQRDDVALLVLRASEAGGPSSAAVLSDAAGPPVVDLL